MQSLLHNLINQKHIKRFLCTNRWVVQLYFNYLYVNSDPYKVESDHETGKFEDAFSLLGNRHFEKGAEIGCGEGRNTWRIAEICDHALALDIAALGIRRAKKQYEEPNVRFDKFDIVKDTFDGGVDYIFCSETLYYLHLSQLNGAIEKIIAAANPGGFIHLLHSRSLKDDESGLELKEFGAKTIHERFISHELLKVIADREKPSYRATILQRCVQSTGPVHQGV